MEDQSRKSSAWRRLVQSSLLAAAVAAPSMYYFGQQATGPSQLYAQQAEEASSVDSKAVAQANTLSTAFRDVAKLVKPSVVSIRTYTNQQPMRGGRSPFGGGQLPEGLPEEFRKFFDLPEADSFGDESESESFGQEEVPVGSGSGVIVSTNGYIITNNHVVESADRLTVQLSDDSEHDAKVIGTDPNSDLAVIKIDSSSLVPIKLGNSSEVQVGDWVVAVGSPFGLSQTVTAGIVSATNRENNITRYDDLIQTDAAINPGNSGGPLVNLKGELIGINTAIASRSGGFNGIGFAIPSAMVDRVLQDILREGRVIRGFIGVAIEDSEENRGGLGVETDLSGVLVTGVGRDGPADKAGLRVGDVIQSIDGNPVKSPSQLRRAVADIRPGETARFAVNRRGENLTINVVAGELTDEALAALQTPEAGSSGLTVTPLDESTAEQLGLPGDEGVLIESVDRNTLWARQAGLRPGDVIVSINGETVKSQEDLDRLLAGEKPLRLVVANSRGERLITIR